MTALTEETLRIEAPGARLAGHMVSAPDPQLAVAINGATGVPAAFYRPFARWLAETREAAVLTYDYRDVAASGSPRRSRATMSDWVLHDPVAARALLRARFPGLPLWSIGHSLGGMAVGFQEDLHSLSRIITVAAGHGHLRDMPPAFRRRAQLLWHVLGPASTALLGYFPGSRFGLGEDLPAGVFRQWRRWLLDDGALPADAVLGGLRRPGFAGPLTTIALADDVMLPPVTVRKMAAWHPEAQIEYRELHPKDFGLAAIGHVQPFSPRLRVLWPALIA